MLRFKQWDCDVILGQYENGRAALQLLDHETGEPICKATTNIPCIEVPDGHVLIKDYAENEGVLQALIEAGYISWPRVEYFKLMPFGKVIFYLCELENWDAKYE